MVKKGLHFILGLFLVLPLVLLFYLSIVQAWVYPVLLHADYSLNLWSTLFKAQSTIAISLFWSLGISMLMALGGTAFGFWISRLISENNAGFSWISLAYFPYLIAPVILGGMLNYYFIRLGLNGTTLGVLIAQSFFIFPFAVLLWSTFWSERVRQICFQAKTLGASQTTLFRSIIFPMARPWLILCLVQCFLISWFEYGMTKFIGAGKVKTLTVLSMHYINEANPHQAAVVACLMIVPPVLLFLLNSKLINRLELS